MGWTSLTAVTEPTKKSITIKSAQSTRLIGLITPTRGTRETYTVFKKLYLRLKMQKWNTGINDNASGVFVSNRISSLQNLSRKHPMSIPYPSAKKKNVYSTYHQSSSSLRTKIELDWVAGHWWNWNPMPFVSFLPEVDAGLRSFDIFFSTLFSSSKSLQKIQEGKTTKNIKMEGGSSAIQSRQNAETKEAKKAKYIHQKIERCFRDENPPDLLTHYFQKQFLLSLGLC